ncbi:alanyl-tRNA editing protein [Aliikangiella sp. IMCC44359]|uniref:alanyl-tRNA editing protein n=1 Tax=Aliikangiella sp. IMCC44359 TaxID=3459125 RepID=UPI00403B1D68
MSNVLFQNDAYLKNCQAKVVKINSKGGIILDQTVFYPTGGGQPGDQGSLTFFDGSVSIATTVKDKDSGEIVHVPNEAQLLPKPGDLVTATIDWEKRYLHMQMHTALHLLCSIIPCGVTGGQISAHKSRLDFDAGETILDKTQITNQINQLIQNNYSVNSVWVDDAELDSNPELVRTMSVKPPRGNGKLRLLKIGENIDLQPCGGTHVKNTSEIGPISVSKIENKGKRNRRVNIVFAS